MIEKKIKKKHKVRSLIFRIILIVIAGLTVGISVYSWNASRVVGNQLPMPFGFGASVVLSGSMEPELQVNDLVFITAQDDYDFDRWEFDEGDSYDIVSGSLNDKDLIIIPRSDVHAHAVFKQYDDQRQFERSGSTPSESTPDTAALTATNDSVAPVSGSASGYWSVSADVESGNGTVSVSTEKVSRVSGEAVELKAVPASGYDVDDIVVYQEGDQLIIHRIVQISDDKVITKGDANNVSDKPIYRGQLKGKYAFRIPFIGFIFKIIKTVPGTLCVLAIVVFLMYRSRKKERKQSDKDLEKIVEEIRALRAQQNASDDAAGSGDDSSAPAETAVADAPSRDEPENVVNGEEASTGEDKTEPETSDVPDGSVSIADKKSLDDDNISELKDILSELEE